MEEKIRNIVEKLNEASDVYYNGLPEIMTNYEWDNLFDELTRLENETGIILPNSPTQKVSNDDISNKVVHKFPALSLQKTKDINELIKWTSDKFVWMSWKLDGLTLVATYEKINDNLSKLKTLATRGNGVIGNDVTHLAHYIKGLPIEIPNGCNMIVRGEAVCSYEDFEEINKTGQFANPRNMASGSMTLLDTNEFIKRKIHFVAFTLVDIDMHINSWGDRMQLLEDNNFEVVDRIRCDKNTIERVKDIFTNNVNDRNLCKYPVDGLVLAYDDTEYANSGSTTGHHATRGGIAFKWADESVESTLKYIDWNCSTNSINPVAVFEPIDILGSTVQRASLHNLSEMKRLNIGGKGTKVEVIKANMIIPQIIRVNEKVGDYIIPTKCPCCNSDTAIFTSDSGTETLICSNNNCGAKNLSKLTRFVSKSAMDIDGLSGATLSTFINKGYINNIIDIYKLNRYYNELITLDGFGKKSVDNLMTAIEKSKNISTDKFLNAFSIPMLGGSMSKELMQKYTLQEFLDMVDNGNETFLINVEGFGQERSKVIYQWFNDKSNREIFDELMTICSISDIKKDKPSNGIYTNYTFVITGDVCKFKNRDELKTYIEDRGGKTSNSVSSKTSYLICNDKTSNSGKSKKAKELNIPIITEEELLDLFV